MASGIKEVDFIFVHIIDIHNSTVEVSSSGKKIAGPQAVFVGVLNISEISA